MSNPQSYVLHLGNLFQASLAASNRATDESYTGFGTLRKQYKLGPYGMYLRLQDEWGERLSPREIADKVKRFHHVSWKPTVNRVCVAGSSMANRRLNSATKSIGTNKPLPRRDIK